MGRRRMHQIAVACPLSGADAVQRFSVERAALIKLYQLKRGINIDGEFDVPEITYYEVPEIDFGFFWPFRAGSKQFYQELTAQPKYRAEKREYALTARYVVDGARVLDVGCGWGWFRKYVAKAEYRGLEVSDEAACVCRDRGIEVVGETIEEHAFRHQEHYDVVTAFQVLEHVEDPLGFVAAMAKCSRGLVVLSVPNKHSYSSVLTNPYLNLPPHHISWWSTRALRYVASEVDLEIEHMEEEAATRDAWCYSALAVQGWLPKRPLVDVSNSGRVFSFLARGIGYTLGHRQPDPSVLRGHSITAVLKKKS